MWKKLSKPIQILKSEYASVENVIKKARYINGVHGAPCTKVLKRKVRQEWENEHKQNIYDVFYVDTVNLATYTELDVACEMVLDNWAAEIYRWKKNEIIKNNNEKS